MVGLLNDFMIDYSWNIHPHDPLMYPRLVGYTLQFPNVFVV